MLHKINISNNEFDKIKKKKQTAILSMNVESFKVNDKVILINGKNEKIKRKIINIEKEFNLEDVFTKIKKGKFGYGIEEKIDYNELYSIYNKYKVADKGILGIEFYTAKDIIKRFFKKISTILFLLILLTISSYFINNFMDDKITKEINTSIKEIKKNNINYIFVDINPSLLLEYKDDKVNRITCLNDECKNIYDSININKTISDTIKEIYDVSKTNGYDVSNGVQIKTKNNINLEDKVSRYSNIEYIDNNKEQELLDEIITLETIPIVSTTTKKTYYEELWDEYKKDPEYGKIYSCDMKNKMLECYFNLEEFQHEMNKLSDFDTSNQEKYNKIISILYNYNKKIINTAKKFNIKTKGNNIILGNYELGYSPLFINNDVPHKNVLVGELKEKLYPSLCEFAQAQEDDCFIKDGTVLIYLNEINLVDPNASLKNVQVTSNGAKDEMIKNYELYQEINKSTEN